MSEYLDGKEWAAIWKKAGPALEAVKEQEWKTFDYDEYMLIMSEPYADALRRFPPEPRSGLVELQRLLHGKKPRATHEAALPSC